MGEISVSIDGRSYPVACDDGQERRISDLASYVDKRMRDVKISGTQNKPQAMVLASLVMADEVFDLHQTLEQIEKSRMAAKTEGEKVVYQGLSPNDEQNIVNLIGQMANKVEKLTARIQKKSA
jgi:cell division protein ZapA